MADAEESIQEQFEGKRILDELKHSYLNYAMSVIVSRALPDVRDGLKPSQRRILVAMDDLNLGPRSKHRKCAKIVGDTGGNYHPHGDLGAAVKVAAHAYQQRAESVDRARHRCLSSRLAGRTAGLNSSPSGSPRPRDSRAAFLGERKPSAAPKGVSRRPTPCCQERNISSSFPSRPPDVAFGGGVSGSELRSFQLDAANGCAAVSFWATTSAAVGVPATARSSDSLTAR